LTHKINHLTIKLPINFEYRNKDIFRHARSQKTVSPAPSLRKVLEDVLHQDKELKPADPGKR
jgi:hypothetical protein